MIWNSSSEQPRKRKRCTPAVEQLPTHTYRHIHTKPPHPSKSFSYWLIMRNCLNAGWLAFFVVAQSLPPAGFSSHFMVGQQHPKRASKKAANTDVEISVQGQPAAGIERTADAFSTTTTAEDSAQKKTVTAARMPQTILEKEAGTRKKNWRYENYSWCMVPGMCAVVGVSLNSTVPVNQYLFPV